MNLLVMLENRQPPSNFEKCNSGGNVSHAQQAIITQEYRKLHVDPHLRFEAPSVQRVEKGTTWPGLLVVMPMNPLVERRNFMERPVPVVVK